MTAGPLIDPRIPADLAAILNANEVSHDEGALLWEFACRSLWVYLSGPDESRSVATRWECRLAPIDDSPHGVRVIGRGQTACLAMARAFAAVVANESPRSRRPAGGGEGEGG